jgi:hypothetical protein
VPDIAFGCVPMPCLTLPSSYNRIRPRPETPWRTRQILDLLFLLGETHSRNRNVSEALQTFKEAFELARAVDSPADLARAAVGATVAETFTGARALESHPLMEAALAALGEAETVERSRLLSQFSYGCRATSSERMR